MKARLAAALLTFAATAGAGSPAAALAREDMRLMARSVGFFKTLPRGTLVAAVVEGPNADEAIATMRRGVGDGGVILMPRRVKIDDLAQSGVKVIVVPEGQGAYHKRIAKAAAALGAITVSTDMSCVARGYCVVGVESEPKANIVVSRGAARASRVSYAEAFRLFIREI